MPRPDENLPAVPASALLGRLGRLMRQQDELLARFMRRWDAFDASARRTAELLAQRVDLAQANQKRLRQCAARGLCASRRRTTRERPPAAAASGATCNG